MDEQEQTGAAGEESGNHAPAEESLRPEPGLEIVQSREFLSENVSISGRHFIRCSFNFCNLIYSGGPVGLVECGGVNNRLVEVGPMQEALKEMSGEAIREKMIRYWKDVRTGLHLEIPAGY
ncbi:MAG: hypothetical protein JWP91_3264 [Fibrobacteres bacterium]|nr:hypothetical protein [Fibrobacterota bacterium]